MLLKYTDLIIRIGKDTKNNINNNINRRCTNFSYFNNSHRNLLLRQFTYVILQRNVFLIMCIRLERLSDYG